MIIILLHLNLKQSIIGNTENDEKKNGIKIAIPLKYLSNFRKSFGMPLVNFKTELSLNWIERCLLTTTNSVIFKITDAKIYVPIVTLSAENNVKLLKLLSKGFKRTVCWNEYKVIYNKIVEIANNNEETYIRELLDTRWQGVKRLFVLAYNSKESDNKVSVDLYKKYFLPRVEIKK